MTDQPTPHSVNLLKGLLFERETRRLDEIGRKLEIQAQQAMLRDKALDARIDAVFDRAGTEEALQHSVAGIIDGALREAEVARHDQLSRAIAPLVVQTIKIQLRDSQDEMVDALYPITGRLVKSYVQSAIADMMAEINAKLGGGRPAQRADQAAASGLSPGELALADANKLSVEELFLLRRSGDLIAHWSRPKTNAAADPNARSDGDERDALVSGYLGGIMALSEDAFGAEPGNFRTVSLGNGERIFVRGSAAHLLAVRCAGSASAPVEAVIDEVFIETLERYQKTLAADSRTASAEQQAGRPAAALVDPKIVRMLPELGQEIEHDTAARQDKLMRQQIAAQPSFRRLYVLFTLLATPFIAWGAWSGWRAYQTALTVNGAQRVLAEVADIKGVPPRIDVAPGGREVTLSGFVPTDDLRERILKRLGEEIPQAQVHNQLGVLPKGSGPAEIAIDELRQQWQKTEAANRAAYELARPFTETTQRLVAVEGDLARLESTDENASTKPALRAAAEDLSQAQAALANARPMIVGADHVDPGVSAPLAAALEKLRSVEAQLSSLFGTAPPPAGGASRSDDPAALAQSTWLAAERIGVLARARLVAPQRSPLEAFAAVVQTSAIFFENNADLRDQAQADATVAKLAEPLKADPDLVLRIVGYTDEKGNATLNTNLGQARANRVAAMLEDKGVAAKQLVAIGRQQAKDLSRATGPGNVNRRVEFEIGLPGEKGDQ